MKNIFTNKREITSSKLIVLTAIFIIAFDNIAFFSNVTDVYVVELKNIAFLASLAIVLASVTVILLSLACYKHTIKPVLITVLFTSSLAGYFMDSYNVIIGDTMIQNIVSTNTTETMDLLSFKIVLYFIFLGVIPSLFVYKTNIIYAGGRKEFASRIKLISLNLALLVSAILIFGNFYASFIREHKPLRYYANPVYYIYATASYISQFYKTEAPLFESIGMDAKIPSTDTHRELLILVVGETARADRFSLNGYKRETNPLLKQENVISFSNFWACGTSTSVSVPCMFSIYGQSEYDGEKAKATENILDVLKHAGVNVNWLDNNSDSKGVALRVPYENYMTSEKNPMCDVECRDEGMLSHIQEYISDHKKGDIFIVLHQMGNHGPAYYKRYPPEFEKYSPTCKTNQLESCSKQEVDNAYDNAILYTDYFLSKVIGLLKQNSTEFESAMFYVSDHGESLGENGLYLHGMPNFIAPDLQQRVPAILWFADNFDDVDSEALKKNRNTKYSHDNLFHTILGFMEIETSIYDKEMDIIHGAQ